MSVSVIIVNWNSGELLKRCVEHLKKQTVAPENIIVVDNDSSDGSANFLDGSETITVAKLSTNIGFAAGNNHAVALCRTR